MGRITDFFSGRDSLVYHSPFDVLYSVNPELGSLAYANSSKILTPDIIPAITNFRKLQHIEKAQLMTSMLHKLGLDSHERQVMAALNNEQQIISSIQNGMIDRQRIITDSYNHQSDNQVRAIDIQARSSFDIQRMKYSADREIVNYITRANEHISDNEYAARITEAKARYDSINFATQMRNNEIKSISRCQLEDKLAYYNSQIKLAEIERDKSIMTGYIDSETALQSLTIQAELERSRGLERITTKRYDFLRESVLDSVKTLMSKGNGILTLDATDVGGRFGYIIRISDDW